MKKTCLVVGIGNPLLRDDRVGIQVVETLISQKVPVETVVLYTVGFELIDKILGYEKVIIVDAAKFGKVSGTILEVKLEDIFTTHALINSHAITLGTTLKTGYLIFPEEMPKELKIILIEAEDMTNFGKECSPAVSQAIEKVVEKIKKDLQSM